MSDVYKYCPDCFAEQHRSNPSNYYAFPCVRHAYKFAEIVLADKITKITTERDALFDKLVTVMVLGGFSTGHGDTPADLLRELEWQLKERSAQVPA